MALRAFILLSVVTLAFAEMWVMNEAGQSAVSDCLKETNVTKDDVIQFIKEQEKAESPKIKKCITCVSKKLNMIKDDNITWNIDVIKKYADKDRFQYVEECLKKDDPKSELEERHYRVVLCVLKKISA